MLEEEAGARVSGAIRFTEELTMEMDKDWGHRGAREVAAWQRGEA